MKKLNKLFAILIAVLGVQTLSAQTDVTSTYLTNAGFDDETSFVNNGVCTYAKDCSANGTTLSQMQPVNGWTFGVANGDARASGAYAWGAKHFLGGNGYTIPSTDKEGNIAGGALGICAVWDAVLYYYQEVTLAPGVYELSYCVYNSGSGATAVNKNLFGFVADNGTSYYGATKTFTSNSWKTESISFTLATETKGKISVGIDAANAGSGGSHHLFVDYIKLIRKSFDEVNAENPVDLTSMVSNSKSAWVGASETPGYDGITMVAVYKGSDWTGDALSQTINGLPTGNYKMEVYCQAHSSWDTDVAAEGATGYTYLCANEYKLDVPIRNADGATTKLLHTFEKISITDGTLKISVVNEQKAANWISIYVKSLTFLGPDNSLYEEAFNTKYSTLSSLNTAEYPAAFATKITNLVNAYNKSSASMTLSELEAANAAMDAVLNIHESIKAEYANLKNLISTCNTTQSNSTAFNDDVATAFASAITTANTAADAATTVTELNNAYNTLEAAHRTYLLNAYPTEDHPFDMTFLIVNPNFDEDKTGWTSDGGAQNKQITDNKPEPITGKYYENWNNGNFTGSIYQEISGLPNGTYKLKAAAFGNNAALFANDAQTVMANNDNTPAWYEVEVKVNKGTLKFGVQNNNNTGWMGIDNVTLQFISGFDLSEIIAEYESARNNAIAARDNADYSVITGLERTNLINAINQTITEETTEKYKEVISILDAATEAFIAAKSDYDTLASEITIAKGLGMTDENVNGIIKDKTGIVALQDLKVAEYNYIQDTYTESATLGSWTENFTEDLDGEGYKVGGPKYLNEWGNATRTAKQTVKLPAGDYAISSIGRGQVGTSGYLYYKIGETTNKVDFIMKGNRGLGVDVNGVANFSGEGEYNCNGEGFGWEYRFITFHLDAETEVEIGVSATFANAWVSIYAPVLLTTEASVKALRLSEIATALGNVPTGKMDATVQAELNDAVAAAESVTSASTIVELNTVSKTLTEAIAKAMASVADYSRLAKYIEMTKVFKDVNAYETDYNNGVYTADDVERVRQELNVLRFNAASEIFPNKIEVTGWEGSMGGKNTSGQHWDGTDTKYYDNNSWNGNAHSTTTSIELPKGTYVLKAALRSHPSTSLSLTVLDKVVNVDGKGDTGYGIDTEGNANFSVGGTYANNNAGRGWEWEFVKFELEETTTVTLKVECNYNGVYGWASFSDITLWMDDATYVTVYGKKLDAPLAEAKTLVNTLPMGETENTALINAIAQGEGTIETPDRLNAAVNALKEAVAKAKTWVSDYNEAKAPLVTAFERFESDYNDGDNGCLLPITDEAWQELLEAVKSAALAKDAYNDYSGFEQAAKNFNEAMDNATYKGFSMSNQLKCTNIILNADCQANDAWAGNGRSVLTGQHWSGEPSRVYFAQNHENGAARNQTVTMPYKGWYILKVSVRAVVANSYVDIQIDGASNKLQGAHGREGGTIATDGTEWENIAAGIAAGKSFANNNKGYGWIYKYIAFNVENTNTEVKIGIALSNKDQNGKEANVGGMELYYVGSNAYVMVGNVVKHYGEYTETIATTHTTHDVTNATMSDLDVNVKANPNALIIANEGQVSNENNVVVNGTASSLVLTEGYTFNATTDFTATALNYAREFSANWLTVCLPFAYAIPENVKVETLSAVDLDTKTFTFEEVTTMEANKPYIIKNSTGAPALFASLNNAEVKATPEAMAIEITANGSEHKAEFIGTYTTVKTNALMEITDDAAKYDILFFGSDGQLYYLSHDVTTKVVNIKPFRAYIRLPKGAIDWTDGQQAIARHGKGTSSIDDVQYTDDNATIIYDLMGRKVTTMVKGNMYIINGRKVIVK